MNTHDRIRQRRESLGLSVTDVANQLGVSRATVYRYESAEIENMGIDKIEPLAKILQTTPAYLMGWTDGSEVISDEQIRVFAEIEIDNIEKDFPKIVEGMLLNAGVMRPEKKLSLKEAYDYYKLSGFELDESLEKAIVGKIKAAPDFSEDGLMELFRKHGLDDTEKVSDKQLELIDRLIQAVLDTDI